MLAQHFLTLVLKFLYKLMDLAWLAKVILIEDILLCFNSQNKIKWFILLEHNNVYIHQHQAWLHVLVPS